MTGLLKLGSSSASEVRWKVSHAFRDKVTRPRFYSLFGYPFSCSIAFIKEADKILNVGQSLSTGTSWIGDQKSGSWAVADGRGWAFIR